MAVEGGLIDFIFLAPFLAGGSTTGIICIFFLFAFGQIIHEFQVWHQQGIQNKIMGANFYKIYIFANTNQEQRPRLRSPKGHCSFSLYFQNFLFHIHYFVPNFAKRLMLSLYFLEYMISANTRVGPMSFAVFLSVQVGRW